METTGGLHLLQLSPSSMGVQLNPGSNLGGTQILVPLLYRGRHSSQAFDLVIGNLDGSGIGNLKVVALISGQWAQVLFNDGQRMIHRIPGGSRSSRIVHLTTV